MVSGDGIPSNSQSPTSPQSSVSGGENTSAPAAVDRPRKSPSEDPRLADARRALRNQSMILYLTSDEEILWERATADGIPPWLEGPGGRCYIEAKSVTLVEKGVGLFPDAPTVRGAKHLRTLETVLEAGHRDPASETPVQIPEFSDTSGWSMVSLEPAALEMHLSDVQC